MSLRFILGLCLLSFKGSMISFWIQFTISGQKCSINVARGWVTIWGPEILPLEG